MFQNLIPIILVLLAYEVHTPGPMAGSYEEPLVYAGLSLLFFAAVSRIRFSLFLRRMARRPGPWASAAFDRISAGQTVLAMGLCAFLLYTTDLKALLQSTGPARLLPTMGSLGFVALFLLHTAVSWFFAFPAYRALRPETGSLKEYLRGNMALSLPALLPWFFISLLLDALRLLPWPGFARFIASPAGELGFFLVFMLVLVIFAPALIARFWGCRPLPPGYPRDLLDDLCRRAGVRVRNILTWPLFGGGMLTAGVMGLVARYRYVLVTPGLMRVATPEELSAVLAHEIGHVKGRHLWLYLLLLSLFGVFSFGAGILSGLGLELGVLGLSKIIPLPAGFFRPPGHVFASAVMILGFLVYFRFFFGYFMRQCERDADLFVFTGLARPQALASCLAKIAFLTGRDPEEPNWHHFGIGERIRHIEACLADPSLIARHKRKLKASLAAFLCFLGILGASGWFFLASETGMKLQDSLTEKTLAAGVEQHPDNQLLSISLGTWYLSREQCGKAAESYRQALARPLPAKDFPRLDGIASPPESILYGLLAQALACGGDEAGAVEAYEESLALFPANGEMANNLAWTLATAQDPKVRDPERALLWAERAAQLLPEAFVLDTLAESLFVNGRYEEAIQVEEEALARAGGGDTGHYRNQLARFRAALSGI